MVSTLLGYKLYATNMTKTLERLESSANVKKDTTYYNENIGKVATVDDLLDDYRLYTYAMKAYGLEDQIASKGLIRKVLESDLSDTNSFANKLTDKKYRSFAAAFNFGTNASAETKVAQTTAQEQSLVDSYDERRVRQATAAAAKTNYYQANINSVQTVDDLLNNSVLYEVVLRSIGADPAATSHDFARQALTNTLPSDTKTTEPIGWMKIHELFNFAADGSVVPVEGTTNVLFAQNSKEKSQLIYNYNKATGNNASSASAAFNTDYFKFQMATGTIRNVDDLLGDPRMFEYIATAFGFDPSMETKEYFRAILADNDSRTGVKAYTELMSRKTTGLKSAEIDALNVRREQFTKLRSVFDFKADGTPVSEGAGLSTGLQSEKQQKTLEDAYFRNYMNIPNSNDKKDTSAFKFLMSKINSVTDLLSKNETFGYDAIEYALNAFDIDMKETSLFQLRRVLTSDVSDPDSFVNKLGDPRFVKLAAAFNFDAEGKAVSQRLAQSLNAQTTTGQKYLASFGEGIGTAKKDVIKADTKAYLEGMAKVTSLDDLLEDTKTLNFALTAYGLEKDDLSTDRIRQILTSDLADRKSVANAAGKPAYVEFAKAFNFTVTGTIQREMAGVQSGAAKLTTANEYLLQTLEQKASDEGQEGVRLALYFRRKAASLTSMAGILADKALLETVKTALQLPDGFTQIDTDKQIATLEKRLKLGDLQDPKTLDKFLNRFSAMYDMANPSSSNGASILGLFGGSGGGSPANAMLALL